jgi:hypothetical protein
MSQPYTCPEGHHWQPPTGDLALLCPVCGGKAVAPVAASQPGTLASAIHSRQPDSDKGERTLPIAAVKPAASASRGVPGYEILGELGRGGMGVV